MHESTLVYRILEEIRPSVGQAHVLKRVHLDVGAFSCVNTTTLTQLFDIVKKNTFAQGSKLKFRVVESSEDIIIRSIEVEHGDQHQQGRIRGRKSAVGR